MFIIVAINLLRSFNIIEGFLKLPWEYTNNQEEIGNGARDGQLHDLNFFKVWPFSPSNLYKVYILFHNASTYASIYIYIKSQIVFRKILPSVTALTSYHGK